MARRAWFLIVLIGFLFLTACSGASTSPALLSESAALPLAGSGLATAIELPLFPNVSIPVSGSLYPLQMNIQGTEDADEESLAETADLAEAGNGDPCKYDSPGGSPKGMPEGSHSVQFKNQDGSYRVFFDKNNNFMAQYSYHSKPLLNGDIGIVSFLFVAEEYRNQGLGTQLNRMMNTDIWNEFKGSNRIIRRLFNDINNFGWCRYWDGREKETTTFEGKDYPSHKISGPESVPTGRHPLDKVARIFEELVKGWVSGYKI